MSKLDKEIEALEEKLEKKKEERLLEGYKGLSRVELIKEIERLRAKKETTVPDEIHRPYYNPYIPYLRDTYYDSTDANRVNKLCYKTIAIGGV